LANQAPNDRPSTGSGIVSKALAAVIALATASSAPWWWTALTHPSDNAATSVRPSTGGRSEPAPATDRSADPQEAQAPAPSPPVRSRASESPPVAKIIPDIHPPGPPVPMNVLTFALSGNAGLETVGPNVSSADCFAECSSDDGCMAASWTKKTMRDGQEVGYCKGFTGGLTRTNTSGVESAIKEGFLVPR